MKIKNIIKGICFVLVPCALIYIICSLVFWHIDTRIDARTDYRMVKFISTLQDQVDSEWHKAVNGMVPTTSEDLSGLESQRKTYDPKIMRYAQHDGRPYLIDQTQLRQILKSRFPKAELLFNSAKYAVMDSDWFKQCYSKSFQDDLYNEYVYSEKFKCDNFAAHAVDSITRIHAKAKNGPIDGEAVAFGELYYWTDHKDENGNKTGHAINLIIFVENGAFKCCCYEPQNGHLITLSDDKIPQVHFIKF